MNFKTAAPFRCAAVSYFYRMKVISANTAKATTINWNGKTETTGIYKYPVNGSIMLGKEAVAGDTIADRRVHGGGHKACYLFSGNHYPYWKSLYGHLLWNWGMFGENLSLEDMDESEMRIGNVYRIGSALVQVSMPREPCYKLGVRFGNQQILRDFISFGYPGTYVRVLEEGHVRAGDKAVLELCSENPLTVRDCFLLYYQKEKEKDLLKVAVENTALPQYKRDYLLKYL